MLINQRTADALMMALNVEDDVCRYDVLVSMQQINYSMNQNGDISKEPVPLEYSIRVVVETDETGLEGMSPKKGEIMIIDLTNRGITEKDKFHVLAQYDEHGDMRKVAKKLVPKIRKRLGLTVF